MREFIADYFIPKRLKAMNLKQLRAFREVMLTGSVSKAASTLCRTQPAVSAQLTSLEKEVGLKLFNRLDGRLHPVPEAEYFLAKATEILDEIDSVQENLARVRNLEVGRINIVAMPGPSIFFLPQLISEFVKNREQVGISLFSHSSFQTQQLLSAQRYDVGVVDVFPEADAGPSLIDYDRLDYNCVCAVSKDDPLATQDSISVRDLDGKPLAMLAETHSFIQQLKQLFEQQGSRMNRRFETQYFIPQLTFVEQGLACAIVDPLTVESYQLYRKEHGSIVFLPIFPAINFSISIITPSHRSLSTLANTFVAYLKEELQRFQ